MTDKSFSGILARWHVSGGTSEDLRTMLISAGWAPPVEKPTRLDGPIAKMESRRRHHIRIAQMDEEYAEAAGDAHEATIMREKAVERRMKASDYELARNILVHIRQGSKR